MEEIISFLEKMKTLYCDDQRKTLDWDVTDNKESRDDKISQT